MMGDFAHADYAGIRLCRYWTRGSVDYPRLITDRLGEVDEATLSQYRKPASERLRVSVVPTGAADSPGPVALLPKTPHKALPTAANDRPALPALPDPQLQPRSFYF
jgi:hypothetical protein